MKYDFETPIRRFNTFSRRYDACACPHEQREDYLILTAADMDFRSPPAVLRALEEAAKFGVFGYSYATDEYFAPIAAWLNRRHGLAVDPAQMLCLNGVISGVKMLIHARSNPGDGVIIMPPVYTPFRWSVQETGRKLVEVPLAERDGRYEMDWEALERACAVSGNRVLLFCSPHNPVGRVWTREDVVRLLELCHRHGVFVISDEIWMDIVFPGQRHTSVLNFPEHRGNLAFLASAAKTFNLGGLVSGFAVIPDPKLLEDLRGIYRQHQNLELHNYFSLRLMYEAYRDPESEQWLNALLDEVRGTLAALDEVMRAGTDGRIRRTPAEGLYLAWLDFAGLGVTTREEMRALMHRAKVLGDPGYAYGPAYASRLRVVVASPRAQVLEAARRLLAAAGSGS